MKEWEPSCDGCDGAEDWGGCEEVVCDDGGRPEERNEGDDVSDEGCGEGADEGFWKSLAMSVFASLAAVVVGVATDTAGEDVEELVVEGGTATDGLEEREGLPFT